MPSHWTYTAVRPDEDLAQGDILEPMRELQGVLSDVHPHFCDAKYLAFLVVTQTCDMVRRKGACNTPYITLAVVKSASAVIPGILDDLCGTDIPNMYKADRRNDATKLIHRLINQNEQSLGLFYLHADNDAGISAPAVAMLRVAISLWAQHYDVLITARRGRLEPAFRSKLGWLVGNLYSRVGTRDWPVDDAKELAAQLLRASGGDWVDAASLQAASERQVRLDGLTGERLQNALKPHAPPDPLQSALERVKAMAEKVGAIAPDSIQTLLNRLRNDGAFKKTLKPKSGGTFQAIE